MQDATREGPRMGIFGGTFDPIHSGHLQIAREAAQTFALDRVLFVPAANPPHKPVAALTPYAHRLRMTEIACAPYPHFSASSLESGPAKSYTVDTLECVRREVSCGNELFFLIGADAFREIETWERWREVLDLTEFIVISRPGASYTIPEHARVHRMDWVNVEISSSAIRKRLAAGRPVPELPAEVGEYIREQGLYGTPIDNRPQAANLPDE
ncbi:MAG: nicotinate-nucleotide adenylyltransferase [Bryobacteraceae bacterium]